MVAPTPVLIVGDAVSSFTGLGRITADIAERADANLKDICRIATLGCNGPGSRRFKFPQYAIEGMAADFIIPNLPDVWDDWAGTEAGVIFFIWDASRLGWFSRPNVMCEDAALKRYLTNAKIQRWIYNPVDAEGPSGRLAYPLIQCLLGFDRILAYGQYGESVIRKSLGDEFSRDRDLGSISHGINSAVFYPRDRDISRRNFFLLTNATNVRGKTRRAILDDEPLVGAVATNQTRKDWGLWAESCALFHERHPKAQFWIHTDVLERNWSIPALLIDFGLIDRTAVSLGYIPDDHMAQAYTACDLTLGIGAGEGFGYPIAESLFCGTPAIHGNYAGAVDFLSEELLINPVVFHLDGLYASRRPVFHPKDWADKMEYFLGKRVNQPSQLDWSNVWPRFDAWFRKALAKQ
jgi:glycosyltransferase involved in cell wall biosynthesis